MKSLYKFVIVLLSGLLALLSACKQNQKLVNQESKYNEGYISGDGIKLHYLDWGGTGPPLVLIHTLGDTPYLFDDLASSLKKNFRVLAYSRRGHCKTVSMGMDYSTSILIADLKLFLDSLKIDKANLLGWSMGGNEITEFAIRHPERTAHLIYLESGYDLSDDAIKNILKTIPLSPFPGQAELISYEVYRTWYHQFWFSDMEWNSSLEANLKASIHINADQSITTLPNDTITKLLLASITGYHRNYTLIQAPALAFYSKPFFIPPVKDENIVSAYDEMEKNIVDPWRRRSMKQIRQELKNVTIKEIPIGSHVSFIFLSKDSLVDSINSFLLNE